MGREPHAAPLALTELEWPAWLPLSTAALGVVAALAGAIQRGGVWPFVFAAVVAAPLLWDCLGRRPLPRALSGGIVLAGAVPLLVTRPPENDIGAFVLVVLGVLAGATMTGRVGVPVLVAALLATVWVEYVNHADDAGALVWAFGVLAGYLGGQAVQKTLLLLHESRVRERETAERLGSQERERIAREVHDVVAHSMAVTLLHVTGARRALEAGDTSDAAEALRDAEELGRAAMTDIRSVVGMLRTSGEERRAPPGLADLPELVRSFTDAGLQVRMHTELDPRAVPPTVGLALYRVVQESLANAAKHAPHGRVELRVVTERDGLRVVVRNPAAVPVPQPRAAGLGLVGMRERVRLLGGSLDADVRGGHWTVEALLPLGPGEAP